MLKLRGVSVMSGVRRFPNLGIHILDGKVYSDLLLPDPALGPLAGAYAEVRDAAGVHTLGDKPMPRLLMSPGGVQERKAVAWVMTAEGPVTRHLDGGSAIWEALYEAAEFNALAGAARMSARVPAAA